MNLNKSLSPLICLTALLTLAGCGGGGSSSPSATSSARGALTLKVKWPALTTRLIPYDAGSIIAVVTDANQNVLGTQTLVRPTEGVLTTTVTFSGLAPGSDKLSATAYPTSTGSGVAQAIGSGPVTVVAGQTSPVTVTMADTIVSVSITPDSPTVAIGATQQLTMTAFDAANDIVLTSPITTKWTSATPANATVSSSGLLTAVQAGSSVITVTETESGKSGQTTVTVPAAVQTTNSPYYVYGDVNSKYVYCDSFATSQNTTNNIDQYTVGANGTLTPMSPSFITLPTGYSFSTSGRGRDLWVDPAGKYIYLVLTNPNRGGNYLLPLTIGPTGGLTAAAPVQLTVGGDCVFGDPAGKYIYSSANQYGTQQLTINADGSLTDDGVNTGVGSTFATIAPNGKFGIAASNGGSLGSYAFTVGAGGALTIVNSIGVGSGRFTFSADSSTVYCDQGTGIVRSTISFSDGTYQATNVTSVYQETINGFGVDSVYSNNVTNVFLRDPAVDNSVDPYLVNATGSSFTPVTPVGQVPDASTYRYERVYIYATPDGKYVYNPNPLNFSISQFSVGSGGGLTPLLPATVPTQ